MSLWAKLMKIIEARILKNLVSVFQYHLKKIANFAPYSQPLRRSQTDKRRANSLKILTSLLHILPMIYAVTSLKGGIGKTTLSQNLAVCFANAAVLSGKKVCLLDTDSEIQSTSDWGKDRGENLPNIHVELVNQDNIVERVLSLKKEFDTIVIDGAPALFELSSRAILLSDIVLIPVLPSIEEVRALERFMIRYNQSKMMKENLGGKVYAAVILNKYNDNIRIDREVKRVLEKMGLPLLESKVSYRVAYREAKIEGKGVIEYLDKKAKEEMEALFQEILDIKN